MQDEHAPIPTRRRRIGVNACLAASAALMVLFAASDVRDAFSTMDQDGFAQSLRQSAWTKALSEQSAAETWPWQSVTSRMSHLPSAKVRRLGLSASVRDTTVVAPEVDSSRNASASLASQSSSPSSRKGDIALGDVGSGTVDIGDSITFTADDGATCVYRVTGHPVVDPHLDLGQAAGAKGEAGLFDCSPLDNLIMRATQKAQKTLPQGRAPEHQRKL